MSSSERPKPSQGKRRRLFEGDELEQTIAAADASYRTLFTVAALTGARLSELLALTWACVRIDDLGDGEIEFAQQVDRHRNLGPTKTDGSARTVHTIPNLSVHLGTFRTRPVRMTLVRPPRYWIEDCGSLEDRREGSDVNLASYLLLDAFRRDCDVAIVFSNDADLKEPIDIAKNELGIKVGVVNPHLPARRSLDLLPTFFKQLRKGPVAACQFAAVMTDAQGQFQKPPRGSTPNSCLNR